jgi:hypothetical protein
MEIIPAAKVKASYNNYVECGHENALNELAEIFNHGAEWCLRSYPKDNYCHVSVELRDGLVVNHEIINKLINKISAAGYYVTVKRNPFADCGFLIKAYYTHPKNWLDKVFNYND